MPNIWDVEDVKNRGKRSCCSLIFQNVEEGVQANPFKLVFSNDGYTVLRI